MRNLCRGLPVPKEIHIPPHVCPTRAISANGCFVQRRVALHHTTCLPIRHGRSPQRVAQGQTRPAFCHTFGCPTRRRLEHFVSHRLAVPAAKEKWKNWRSLILQEFRHNLITWKLAELLCSNSCVIISAQMNLFEVCRFNLRSGSPASQRLCK